MSKLRQTPSQTVGPFFAYGLTAPQYNYNFTDVADNDLRMEGISGEVMTIIGHVLDGAGNPVDDALVEIWQADGQGIYPSRQSNSAFKGFGRMGTGTDPQNRFLFETIKPGSVGDGQAPHVNVVVFMRGGLNHHYTRMYFDGDAMNKNDPVLRSVPDDRRHTLMARHGENGTWHFDIHMQGEDETVFFDV